MISCSKHKKRKNLIIGNNTTAKQSNCYLEKNCFEFKFELIEILCVSSYQVQRYKSLHFLNLIVPLNS